MTTYILSNGMLATGDMADTVFYAGKFYGTEEDMEGDFSFTDAEGNELTFVGLMEEIEGQSLAFYAANEDEYDTIREHISVNGDQHWTNKIYCVINGRVFFGYGWDSEELSHFDDTDGDTYDFKTKAEAQAFADKRYPKS